MAAQANKGAQQVPQQQLDNFMGMLQTAGTARNFANTSYTSAASLRA